MGLLRNIKNFFYRHALKKEIAETDRAMINLKNAKKIGILFNATDAENSIVITQYAQGLQQQGKDVYILGYQNTKSKTPLGTHFFDKNDLNWFDKPASEKITTYRKMNFDILICAFFGECHPLEYIAATSNAKFRVGAFSQSNTDCFELMINVKGNFDLKYLLQQITHFLNDINKNVA